MTKKVITAFIIIAVIVLAFAAGFRWGQKQGQKEGEARFRYLVDRAYPPPPAEMKSLSGIIKGIYGATIDLEVIDPDDYLPHPDGSPQRREVRFATVTSATQFILKDYTKPDTRGNPKVSSFSLSKLKVGDAVTVKSDQNIRNEKKFDIVAVELVRY